MEERVKQASQPREAVGRIKRYPVFSASPRKISEVRFSQPDMGGVPNELDSIMT